MSAASNKCDFCSFDVPLSSDRCPHCARPSLFPNVSLVAAKKHTDALDARFRNMAAGLNASLSTVLQQFSDEVNRNSETVIARPAAEALRLASSDKELYASFYELLEAGARLSKDDFWDTLREIIDTKLFPYFKEKIRFGALTLNGKGLNNYGECFILLREDMIGHRSTVFEENTVVFCNRIALKLQDEIPPGHSAQWNDRGRLAAVKLYGELRDGMTTDEFPSVLMKSGATSADDDFIEVHVYGPISIRSVSSVSIDRRKTCVRTRALQEKLAKQGIELNAH